jgi:membrane associated rhomboid family serine protease
MPTSPTDRGGLGAVSLGHMVVVCEAFEKSVAQRAAELLESKGIPALLQSSENGLPNIPTPPSQREGSIFIVVPSSLETEAVAILREEQAQRTRAGDSRPSRALKWSQRWSRPKSPASESTVTTLRQAAGASDEDDLQVAVGLPDPGPTFPRLVFVLSAIAFGMGLQLVLENVVGAGVFRSTFAASTQHPDEWWRLITAGFVHFGFGHHFYNALFGGVLGVILFGSHRPGATMSTWLVASILGLLGQLSSPDTMLVAGASAGNYGLIGLWAKGQLERSNLSLLPRRERLRTLGVLLLLIPGALTPVSSTGSNVAVLAHVIGFVAGFLMGTVFHRRLGQLTDPQLERRSQYGFVAAVLLVVLSFSIALPRLWS